MSEYTVGDLVAEFLAACGVGTVFGIASVHNIPMLDAIGRRNAIRFVMARGELGGAHMADGYARASGHLGVIISSTGPGAANAVGGLVGRTPAACRQLARRARLSVGTGPYPVEPTGAWPGSTKAAGLAGQAKGRVVP